MMGSEDGWSCAGVVFYVDKSQGGSLAHGSWADPYNGRVTNIGRQTPTQQKEEHTHD